MKALSLLREHLLKTINISAENLVTFVENGTVYTVPGPKPEQGGNSDFELRYQGIIYVLKPTQDARYICWVIGEWMNDFQPERSDNAIQFDADILSHDQVEFEFRLDFREEVRVTKDENGGITLTSCFCGVEDSPPMDVLVHEGGNNYTIP